MYSFLIAAQVALLATVRAAAREVGARARSARAGGHAGQATAEYALVLLGAAAIALMLAAWAAKSGKIGELFDAVVDQLIDKAG